MKHVFIILFLVVSQSKTLAEELHGIFMVVKGDVEVESKKTGKFKAKVSSKVYAGDTVTTLADGRGKIVMSDRNVLNLSPDTQMTINKYENDSTTGIKNVDIDLSKGKLRSNVEQKYDGEKSQFLIKTPTAVAGVRGTQFATSFNPTTQQTQIVTFKGIVALSVPGSTAPPVMVKKGQTSSVSQGQAAPEPPKNMDKKDLDKENKSSNSAKAEPTAADGNAEVKTEVTDNKKSDKSDKKEDSSGEKKEQKRSVAAAEESGSTKEPKMIDKKDMDIEMAKEVKAPVTVDPPVAPPPRPPVVKEFRPPEIPKTVTDNISNKTKVIIVPKLPGQ
ncbi:MAG: FecR domain-containing protein [Bdellovibrionaceae bacterium]|nr:FecR domain-containing protein [Pseudobdellovibrionaceae bacterium]